MIVGFGALLLLGRLQVPAAEHHLLFIGWTFVFYRVLSVWCREDYRKFPDKTPAYVEYMAYQPQESVVAEFYDKDRIALQREQYDWDQDAATDSQREIV
jgi:hypothetical protein